MSTVTRRDCVLIGLALAGLLLLLSGFLLLAVHLLFAELAEAEALLLRAALLDKAPLLIMLLVMFSAVAGMWLYGQRVRHVLAARRMAEQTRLIVASSADQRVGVPDQPELAGLASAINDLAEERVRHDQVLAERIATASAEVAEERNRLAALMSQLSEAVLVCNPDGQILLYNARARQLLGNTSGVQVGLGRSIFALIDRKLITHALDSLGSPGQGAQGPVRFVSTSAEGALLRVLLTPVHGGDDASPHPGGYVLTLQDVTGAVRSEQRQLRQWRSLMESSRAALGSIRAAVETLSQFPEMDEADRGRFVQGIQEQSLRLSVTLQQASADLPEHWAEHHALDVVRAEDLLASIKRRIEEQAQQVCRLAAGHEALWLKVDSFALTLAMAFLARRLREELGVAVVTLSVAPAGSGEAPRWAELDLQWSGNALPAGLLGEWENHELRENEQEPCTLALLMQRHGGDVWQQFDADSNLGCIRLVLPMNSAPPQPQSSQAVSIGSRPEFYDFDLFNSGAASSDLDELPLTALSYTVFDTETTGLDPAGGDEIISLGAVRIVNARLLRMETFDQLVDPRRSLPAASTRIHGISAEMLQGQPGIEEVLPRFHQFCEGTVLVAHNAAFDLRFLELKQVQCNVRFEHPVLDTLLLSALAHPHESSHNLEALAQRFGLHIVGRHTALGDAMVTGEALLKLIPLLAARGIRTLREAREAAARTYYARIRY